MTTDGTARTTRREQREASRRRLHAATIDCLVEYGYGATTTVAIARRAELSNGALFHLYDSKEDLIVAAVVDLIQRLVACVNDDLAHLAGDDARQHLDAAQQVVDRASAAMRSHEAQALLEFYAAARTHPRLQKALAAVEADMREGMISYTARLFPQLAGSRALPGLVGLIVTSVLGATLLELATGGAMQFVDTRSTLVTSLERAIDA